MYSVFPSRSRECMSKNYIYHIYHLTMGVEEFAVGFELFYIFVVLIISSS